MSALFRPRLACWDDWCGVYQNIEAFRPLIEAMYEKEGLARPGSITHLTPGTNAVFRCGDTVVKVFVPVEAGMDSRRDFAVETAMLRYAQALGLPTSDIIAAGCMEDRYAFPYMILRFLNAQEAGDVLPAYSDAQQKAFALALRHTCDRLNQPNRDVIEAVDLKARALHNPRLERLPDTLREDMRARVQSLSWEQSVPVHGDITGENVLVGADGTPMLIDFADSVLGPFWYEWPPVVFELFRCDPVPVRAFIGKAQADRFVPLLLDALSLHDFGANILLTYCERNAMDIAAFPTLAALQNRLRAVFDGTDR